jgi:transposase
VPPCLVGMEACVGAHHLSRKLKALGHDARLMPAKYVHRADTIGLRKDTAIICQPIRQSVCGNCRVTTNRLISYVFEH